MAANFVHMIKGSNKLLQFPREIRDHIYQFVIPGSLVEIAWDTSITALERKLPPISLTSRQMHDETVPIFLQNTIWILPHMVQAKPFSDLLYSFPNGSGFLNIRFLMLTDLSILTTKLLKYCQNLRILIITFDGPEIAGGQLVKNGHWELGKLTSKYDIDVIFQLRHLKRLVLAMRNCEEWARPQFSGDAIMLGLEMWFQERFARKGNRVGILSAPYLSWNAKEWIDELGL
ncbi:hypothetical protein CC78DRAFT_534198 [Lojkania enalia]|uniref:F-box domain-containing protein n=1 Tax=Lojkania enalia TaxID=147567 RepID=A0A9P4MZ16_9PLEO|nr:hypothetical protein CC78DRAFT_534198 [Didymosphaeria enalia]